MLCSSMKNTLLFLAVLPSVMMSDMHKWHCGHDHLTLTLAMNNNDEDDDDDGNIDDDDDGDQLLALITKQPIA